MTRSFRTFCLLLALAVPLSAAAPVEWRYTQKDVYVDGAIDRSALVYRTSEPDRTVVLVPGLGSAIVFDTAAAKRSTVDLDAFTPSKDRTTLTTNGLRLRAGTSFTRTEDGVLATRIGRHDVLVADHESPAGPLDVQSFLRDYPVWDALRAAWTPDPSAVARLAAVDEPTDVTLVFATWCGDSRHEVPRALRALELADNPNLRVHLVGVSSDFDDPLDFIEQRHIINVPTMIVERDGMELGRFVETPASGGSSPGDLAEIVSGSMTAHPGRWEREAEIASGRYAIRFDDAREGSEHWTIFATADGGRLAHSVIRGETLRREVWHRIDASGETTFVEVTDNMGDELRRTRYWKRGTRLEAHSRGSDSGIIDQVVELPEHCGVCTGSIATEAIGLSSADVASYVVPLHGTSTVGVIRRSKIEPVREEIFEIEGREHVARWLHASSGETHRDVWVDRDLGVPLKVNGEGFVAELVELETNSRG